MHRTEAGDALADKFGIGKPGYQDPTPAPNDGTTVSPDAGDSWQEELCRVVEERAARTGISLNDVAADEGDYRGYYQVSDAINRVSTDALAFGRGAWCAEQTPFSYNTGVGLTQPAVPSTVYVRGRRVAITAGLLSEIGETNHTFTASTDTYVGLNPYGTAPALSFSEVANDDPPPAPPAGERFIAKVVTNAVSVVSVTTLPYFYLSTADDGGLSREAIVRRALFTNKDPITGEAISVQTPLTIDVSGGTGALIKGTGTNLLRITPDNAADTTRAVLIDGPGAGQAVDQDLVSIVPSGDGDGVIIDTSTTRRAGLILQTFDTGGLEAIRAPLRIVPYTVQHPSSPTAGDLHGLRVSGADRLYWYDSSRFGRVHETPTGPIYDGTGLATYTHTNPQTNEEVWLQKTVSVQEGDVVKFSFVGDLETLDAGVNAGAMNIRHRIRRSTNGAPIISGTIVYDFTHKHQTFNQANYTMAIRHGDLIYAVGPGITSVTFGYTLQRTAPVNDAFIMQVKNGLASAQFGQAAA